MSSASKIEEQITCRSLFGIMSYSMCPLSVTSACTVSWLHAGELEILFSGILECIERTKENHVGLVVMK